MKQRIGKYMMFFAIAASFLETTYFGHNLNPESVAELVCDSICLAIAFVGAFLYRSKN